MRAIEIAEGLANASGGNVIIWHGESVDDFFGDCRYSFGLDKWDMHRAAICIYSDCDNPLQDYTPDATLVLDDGRCVFFYEIPND